MKLKWKCQIIWQHKQSFKIEQKISRISEFAEKWDNSKRLIKISFQINFFRNLPHQSILYQNFRDILEHSHCTNYTQLVLSMNKNIIYFNHTQGCLVGCDGMYQGPQGVSPTGDPLLHTITFKKFKLSSQNVNLCDIL